MKYGIDQYCLVEIDDLYLDPENPRNDEVSNDELVLEEMMKTYKFNEKIISLMKDILENGTNPLDVVGVYLDSTGKLYSKEGNRRVAALKILNHPEIIRHTNIKLYTKVLEILEDYDDVPNSIMCYISNDLSVLSHAMGLKHQGEQNGKGTVSWGSEEKARYRRSRGQSDPMYAFLNEMEDKKILKPSKRNNITKTNWERIFTGDGRTWLGISKTERGFVINIDQDLFEIKFKLLVDRVENQTHHIVNDKETRKILFDELDVMVNEKMNKKDKEPVLSKVNPVAQPITVDDDSKNNNEVKQLKLDLPNSDNDPAIVNKVEKAKPNDEKKLSEELKLSKLYVARNSKIDGQLHKGVVNVINELKLLSNGKYPDYRKYKLCTYFLIRTLIEQCLKYWMSYKFPKKYDDCQNNGDANLGKMINELNKLYVNKNVIFNKEIDKKFNMVFGNYAAKDFLDKLIHHPSLLPNDNGGLLISYANGQLYDILNYILTYEEDESKKGE